MDHEEQEQSVLPTYQCRDFNDIARCFEQMHKSVFSKINNIEIRTKTLEDKLESTNLTLATQNDLIKYITETRLVNIDEKIEEEEKSRLTLEVWGRKWNLVIRGIDGTTRESPRETEEKVREFLSRELNLNEHRMLFAAVHRLPVRPTSDVGNQSGNLVTRVIPNILVRFVNIHDRDTVMQAAMKNLTPGCGTSVVPDLPPQINKIRQSLLLERKNMLPEEKKKIKLVYTKFYPFVLLKTKQMKCD